MIKSFLSNFISINNKNYALRKLRLQGFNVVVDAGVEHHSLLMPSRTKNLKKKLPNVTGKVSPTVHSYMYGQLQAMRIVVNPKTNKEVISSTCAIL